MSFSIFFNLSPTQEPVMSGFIVQTSGCTFVYSRTFLLSLPPQKLATLGISCHSWLLFHINFIISLKTNLLVMTAVETWKFYCITFNIKKEEIYIILTYNFKKSGSFRFPHILQWGWVNWHLPALILYIKNLALLYIDLNLHRREEGTDELIVTSWMHYGHVGPQ